MVFFERGGMVIGYTAQTCSVHGELSVHVILDVPHFNCSAHIKVCKKCLEKEINETQTKDDW